MQEHFEIGIPEESGKEGEAEKFTTLERGEDLLSLFGDSDRHERRVQRAVPSESDHLFWATITIACGEPNQEKTQEHLTVAKKFGTLAKARNDLDAFYEYYRPMMLGDPRTVAVVPGLGKSPGFFATTIALDNPTVEDLRRAIQSLQEWIEVNQEDPEYTSFQLNFCFSGHGYLAADDHTGIVLADDRLDAYDLTSFLLSSIPEREISPGNSRLDLYLDCCYSSAVARSVVRTLRTEQLPDLNRSYLDIGQVYCSSLDDEESFERNDIYHSLFTFAFLNECSRRIPEGASKLNIGLRDICWLSNSMQHPLLLDFTVPQGLNWKFPALYYLKHSPNELIRTMALQFPPVNSDLLRTDPIGELLKIAHAKAAELREVEYELRTQPEMRKPYSREEIMNNQNFPFL